MDTWVWILIAVIVVVVLLAIAIPAIKKGRERKVEQKREEATTLRQEAEERLAVSGQREAKAQQEAERAARERAAAEENIRRAEEVDPDVPDVDPRGEDGTHGATRATS